MNQVATFDYILELVENLPDETQEDLIDIIRKRLIERRRQEIADSIVEAEQEYKSGNLLKGTVDDIMSELMK